MNSKAITTEYQRARLDYMQAAKERDLALQANAALEQAILDKNKYIAALEKRIDDLKGQLSNERMRNPPPLTLSQADALRIDVQLQEPKK